MVRSLYKSADLKIESSVTFDLADGVNHMRLRSFDLLRSTNVLGGEVS